ncbi:MAG: hypothetical protein GY778_13595 [bacterium]|nr:hypothetical protein [bacterium]
MIHLPAHRGLFLPDGQKPMPWLPGIDRQHPLADGAFGYWPLNEGAGLRTNEALNEKHGTLELGAGWSGSEYGHVVEYLATSNRINCGVDFVGAQGGAFIILYRKTDGTDRTSKPFGGYNASGTDRLIVHLPHSNGNVYWDWGGTSEGTTRVSQAWTSDTLWHVWAFTTGPRGMEIWLDGKLFNSNIANPTRTPNSGDFYIGGGSSSGINSDLAQTAGLIYFDRQISPNAIKALSADIFSVARPQSMARFESLTAAATRPPRAGVMIQPGVAA